MWTELKKELSMEYFVILSDTHAPQALTHLEQGPDELFDDFLHSASELLSKIHYTSDMSNILAEDTDYYAVVYGLNCWKLKDSITGQQSMQWRMTEECFRDIYNISTGYE